MQLEFYIDVYFFINFIMNFILMFLLIRLRKQKLKIMRLFLSASTGAVIACIMALMNNLPVIITLLTEYLGTGMLMIWIGLGYGNKRRFVQNYLAFLLCSFLLGGLIQSFSETFQKASTIAGFYQYIQVGSIGFYVLIILSILLSPIVLYIYHLLRENRNVLDHLYEVELERKEQLILTCKGFMDTGNSLRDPFSGRPVIIVDSVLLDNELKKIQEEDPTAFCVIPYASVGKEQGVLYGFRVDSITISNANEKISTKNVVVALSDHGFLNKSEYRMLLHSDLLGSETK